MKAAVRFLLTIIVVAMSTGLAVSKVYAQGQVCWRCVNEPATGWTCKVQGGTGAGHVSCEPQINGCILGDYCDASFGDKYEAWSAAGTLLASVLDGGKTVEHRTASSTSRTCSGWILARVYNSRQVEAIRERTRNLAI